MTPTEINREFAEKVMGWKLVLCESPIPRYGAVWYWCKVDGITIVMQKEDFKPYHRWDHAAMGLEKFEDYDIYKRDNQFMVRIVKNSMIFYSPWADTAPAAICIACIEAKKEKG